MWTGNEDSSESLGCSDWNNRFTNTVHFLQRRSQLVWMRSSNPFCPSVFANDLLNLIQKNVVWRTADFWSDTRLLDQRHFKMFKQEYLQVWSCRWINQPCRSKVKPEIHIWTDPKYLHYPQKTKQNTRTFSGNSMLALANPHLMSRQQWETELQKHPILALSLVNLIWEKK